MNCVVTWYFPPDIPREVSGRSDDRKNKKINHIALFLTTVSIVNSWYDVAKNFHPNEACQALIRETTSQTSYWLYRGLGLPNHVIDN